MNGMQNLHIADPARPLVQSPESSPITTTAPSLPSSPSNDTTPKASRKRTPSLYSQWDLAEAAEESSDDDEAYLTPDEGLSEVEEADEEEEERPKVTNPTLDATNVSKGSEAATGDVLGTGPSTIRRSKPSAGETKVRTRTGARVPAAFSQSTVLGADIDACREILTLFLTSKMKEAEEMCFKKDPDGNHMYLLSAHSIINGLKVGSALRSYTACNMADSQGMMTFDSNDLANALELCKQTSLTASELRRPSDSIVSRLGGLVRAGAGVARVKAMSALERHAELVYAETALMKAMLAIIAGGDWLGLVREA